MTTEKAKALLKIAMEPELSPCPFCGDIRAYYYKNPDVLEGPKHEVSCPDCETVVCDYSKEKVIEKWNRRLPILDDPLKDSDRRVWVAISNINGAALLVEDEPPIQGEWPGVTWTAFSQEHDEEA